MFRKYDKIHRLGKEETDGILEGPVTIQEKIDGANTSIWVGEDGYLRTGSRNNDITGADFNGFNAYVQTHEGIKKLLIDFPQYTLYGEWLVRHTILYKETAYKKWYMFDIYDNELGEYIPVNRVMALADQYEIDQPLDFGVITVTDLKQLEDLVGKTGLGEKGEGIVIKRYGWKNSFGEHAYAKMVTEDFKEDNAVTFGGNNKFSDTYEEVYLVNKFMTLGRVQKVMNKIQPEVNERLSEKHIPRIMMTAFHDMITEEAWTIASRKKKIDFAALQRISFKKARQIFMDILHDSISVADLK